MNKPTPAIDENGEFVVAKLRGGQQAAVFCIDPLCALLDSSIVSEWLEDGRWSHESKHDHYLDIVNLDEIRATVERARKARDFSGLWEPKPKVHYDADGAASTDSRSAAEAVLRNHVPRAPARPSFAEALETAVAERIECGYSEPERGALVAVYTAIQRARRASEGK